MSRPNILHPEFTWHTAPTVDQLRKRLSTAPYTPRLRRVTPFWVQRIIWPLPFGLLLKHSDGTRIEEVVTTRAAYEAGIPVPKIISYGAHLDSMAEVSILMTRMPGEELFQELWEWFEPEEKQTTILAMKEILRFVHNWGRNPSAKSALICSIMGTPIRSVRVPYKLMPPCLDEAEFNRRLIQPADPTSYDFEEHMARAKTLDSQTHEVVFTHGDLAPHNMLVMSDGRIAGLIDWEAAGYYPNYWEYTTAWGIGTEGWWFDLVHELADGKYHNEREADAGRWLLTNGTMCW
ncbi:hypothetical protein DV738_g786, partial [Chaetothyriales sp. CBS 135597]